MCMIGSVGLDAAEDKGNEKRTDVDRGINLWGWCVLSPLMHLIFARD